MNPIQKTRILCLVLSASALCGTLPAAEPVDHPVGVTLPEDAIVTYTDRNPLRDALRPVPVTAIFEMKGYSVWDPSLIKVGDTYHLFCSRWPSKQDPQEERHAWKRSQVIRATSKSLFGPYEFQDVVLDPPEHPWATEGIHNPKITRSGNRFLLYHLGIPGFQTGFSFADSIEGPWESLPAPVVRANNPALLVRPDGSVYMVAKAKTRKPTSGRWDNIMQAYEADTISGLFTLLGGSENRLPYDLELEDPTVWWADNQYHVICTDWEGKITGVMKSVVYFTSRDGIRYELVSRIPVWSQTDPIPMADGTSRIVNRVERPQVYVNEKGEVEALLVAVGKEPHRHDFIAIRPVDQFIPGEPKP